MISYNVATISLRRISFPSFVHSFGSGSSFTLDVVIGVRLIAVTAKAVAIVMFVTSQ